MERESLTDNVPARISSDSRVCRSQYTSGVLQDVDGCVDAGLRGSTLTLVLQTEPVPGPG